MSGVFQVVGTAEIAKVNLLVAALIWLMIVPVPIRIDLAALGKLRRHWCGIGVTLFINRAVKPFSMTKLIWFFPGFVVRPDLPEGGINPCIAGAILLAAGPARRWCSSGAT
ncbi:hypothetical protein GR328_08545 [Microvirga makkahensis]|uniref:Uncharacterized protein n=1 Tax=Microvirga makkahensis TaxID=1128670 RepID=A0A7X3MQT4_9HYPH|nr:hypothetical protein [Microvirga makkahensis]